MPGARSESTSKRWMRRAAPYLILAVAVAVVLGITLARKAEAPVEESTSPAQAAHAGSIEATLTEVVDGDTIWVVLADGSEEKVRYIGIDAPEVAHEDSAGEYLGEEATAHNAALLDSGPLRLELDVDERDDFGRLLAYVWSGEVFVNEQMVADGLARANNYPPNLARQDLLWAAHDEARAAGLGVWAEDRD